MSKTYPCTSKVEDDCGYPTCAHAAQCERSAKERLARTTCSQLRNPDDAPRDGTMILAALGWPWLVPAVWDEDANEWAVCAVHACQLKTGAINRYWENDSERPRYLQGWLPWPELPGGYVFRPANVQGDSTTPADGGPPRN